MAFEARAQELEQRFAFFKTTLPPDDYIRVSLALTELLKRREAGLVELGDIAAEKGDRKIADNFRSKLDTLSKFVLNGLANLLEGYKEPPQNLIAFRDIAASEERKFWEGLERCKIGETHDEQMLICNRLEEKAAIYGTHWANLSQTEKDLLDRERYAAGKLREIVNKMMEEVVPAHATGIRDALDAASKVEQVKKQINDKFKELLREAVKRVGLDPKKADELLDQIERQRQNIKDAGERLGIDPAIMNQILELTRPGNAFASYVFTALSMVYNPLGGAAKMIGKGAKAVLPVAQSYVDQCASEMLSFMGGRKGVIMSFSTVRREATDYVLNNGYEKAKQYRSDAVRAMEDWQSAQATDGLKANVRTFTARADDSLTYWVEFMRKVHQTFVDKFKGILVESISNETIDALADRPFYEQWANGIDRLDLDQQLQRLYAGIYEIQGNVDRAFGAFTTFNELPYEAQALLQETVNRLESELRAPATQEMQEALKTMDAARGRAPASVAKNAARAVQEIAQQVASAGR
ncbi:hypothetical protein [Hyalangium versicolor]|uniref:hypothetical protein n=1 Tax=Hyalangium versicolor TaxID=2861190 RepID=UPI001CCAFB95|nr:hypothetical protein [Hyalangium versicolor]